MGSTDGQQVMGPANARLTSFKGERLKGASNYPTWAFAFKAYLGGIGAGDLITSQSESPKESEVFSKLVGAIESSVIVEIMQAPTVFQAWAALKERYATVSTAHVVAIAKQLRSKEFRSGNLAEYLQEMRGLHISLKGAGGLMDEGEFVRLLLTNIVADHLAVMVTILANSGDLSIQTVCSKLLLEDDRLKTKKKTNKQEALLFSNDKGKGRKSAMQRKETRTCFKCDKVGHLAANCRSESGRSAKADASEYLLSARPDGMRAASGQEEHLWADSGASSHMCGNRNRFKEYEALDSPIDIILGDNRSVQARGKGSMTILNDSSKTITLTNVLYCRR
jgi:hypothetical protein